MGAAAGFLNLDQDGWTQMCTHRPLGRSWRRTSLHKTPLFFECFPYVCPEPVLVKCSVLDINGIAKSVVFRTLWIEGLAAGRADPMRLVAVLDQHRRPGRVDGVHAHLETLAAAARTIVYLQAGEPSVQRQLHIACERLVGPGPVAILDATLATDAVPCVKAHFETLVLRVSVRNQRLEIWELQENASSFECFPYVCPEPVLAK